MSWELVVSVAGGLVTIAGAWALLRGTVRRINNFLDDWNGEPERPGVDEKPGVMTRLKKLEDGVGGLGARLAKVELRTEQLSPNGGSSMRDQVSQLVEHMTEAG